MSAARGFIDNLAEDREWFFGKYSESLGKIEVLHSTVLDFLEAVTGKKEATDKIVLFLARSCLREFNEILLLCSNRYGIGALKILRPLYERVVTLKYVAQHPCEAEQFIQYSDIHWHKLLVEADSIAVGKEAMTAELTGLVAIAVSIASL